MLYRATVQTKLEERWSPYRAEKLELRMHKNQLQNLYHKMDEKLWMKTQFRITYSQAIIGSCAENKALSIRNFKFKAKYLKKELVSENRDC